MLKKQLKLSEENIQHLAEEKRTGGKACICGNNRNIAGIASQLEDRHKMLSLGRAIKIEPAYVNDLYAQNSGMLKKAVFLHVGQTFGNPTIQLSLRPRSSLCIPYRDWSVPTT